MRGEEEARRMVAEKLGLPSSSSSSSEEAKKVVIIKLGEHVPYSIVKIEINRDKTPGPIDIFCSLPSRR